MSAFQTVIEKYRSEAIVKKSGQAVGKHRRAVGRGGGANPGNLR